MNKREAAIVTAYTSQLIGEFSDFHKYAEEILGRSIMTHEFSDKEFFDSIKALAKMDYFNLSVEL